LHQVRLEGLRRGFERTEGNAKATNLFMALVYCVSGALPLPKWAADAFNASARSWLLDRAATLDEAFGVTKQKHFRAKVRKQKSLLALAQKLEERREKGLPHDWNAMAEELGDSHKYLEDPYRSNDILRELFPTKNKNRRKTRR
jgi:hypothetical protein